MPSKIPEPAPIQVLDEKESSQKQSERLKQLAEIELIGRKRQDELRKVSPDVRMAEYERCPRKRIIAEAIADGAIDIDKEHPCFLPPEELRKRARSSGYTPVHDPNRQGEYLAHDDDVLTVCPKEEYEAQIAYYGKMSRDRMGEPTEESKASGGMVTEEVKEGEKVEAK